MKRRHRQFTLLEILIAMGLASVLLLFLFSAYGQVLRMQGVSDRGRQQLFSLRYTQSRLSDVFYRTVQNSGKGFVFFTIDSGSGWTRGPSLVFTYMNEYASGPLFANEVIGRLYVDEEGQLSLATWPIPQKTVGEIPPMRKEVLMDGVESISFQFYYPQDKEAHPASVRNLPEASEPTASKLLSWERGYQRLPVIVRIELRMEAKGSSPISFAFTFPRSRESIFLREEA